MITLGFIIHFLSAVSDLGGNSVEEEDGEERQERDELHAGVWLETDWPVKMSSHVLNTNSRHNTAINTTAPQQHRHTRGRDTQHRVMINISLCQCENDFMAVVLKIQ